MDIAYGFVNGQKYTIHHGWLYSNDGTHQVYVIFESRVLGEIYLTKVAPGICFYTSIEVRNAFVLGR